MKSFFISLLGAPGVGKTTIARQLSKLTNAYCIEMGDLIRNEIKNGTSVGLQVSESIARGEIVDGQITNQLVKNWMSKKNIDCNISTQKSVSIIFDGFPRTMDQIVNFEKEITLPLDFVFNLTLSQDILIERLKHRRICDKCNKMYNLYSIENKQLKLDIKPIEAQKMFNSIIDDYDYYCNDCQCKLTCRQDDDRNIIENRMKEHELKTMPVCDYFEQQGKLISFQIERGIDDDKSILQLLNHHMTKLDGKNQTSMRI